MGQLLLIHSLDNTTAFLNNVGEFFKRKGFSEYHSIVIEDGKGDVASVRNQIISLPEGATIIFLGHGASHCIYMPLNQSSSEKLPLLQGDYFHILRNKNFVSLSCRSAEFISRNFFGEVTSSMIGFDDLPTHWQDVYAMREVDVNAYAGITDLVLENFRNMLVDIFKFSLLDTIVSKSDFSFFYLRIRLYTNLFIVKTNTQKISDNPTLLANLLFDLKNGTKVFGNRRAIVVG